MSIHLHQAQLRRSAPTRHLPVYRAAEFRVIDGVNDGDPLTDAADLAFEDVFALTEAATPVRLGLVATKAADAGPFLVSRDSAAGQPGAAVYLDSLLTFMGPGGSTRDALVFVEVETDGTIAEVYLHPLAPLERKKGYILVTIDREGARARLAGTASVTFTEGTKITLASGAQRPVEALRPGDRVLTRDNGPQALRWIGHETVRAAGAFAPITIRAGTLHNTGDLVVSPGHRLFVYQRVDALGAGRKEVMVRAEHLVNGSTVTRDEGGFIDYYQLLFDRHEIIYAEGIAAESQLVDAGPPPALPGEVGRRVSGLAPPPRLHAHEIREAEMRRRRDAAEVLRRLSAF